MARQKGNTSRKPHTETSSNILRQMMFGQIVSSDFFARNWVTMIIVVMMIMVYIAGKYTCQRKMEQVRKLSAQLETVQAERIRAQSEYMGNIRESEMQKIVDRYQLGLRVQEYPPFIIETK